MSDDKMIELGNKNEAKDEETDLIVDDIIVSDIEDDEDNDEEVEDDTRKTQRKDSNLSMKSADSRSSRTRKKDKLKIINMKGLGNIETKEEVESLLGEHKIECENIWLFSHSVFVQVRGKSRIKRLLNLELYRNERKVRIFIEHEQQLQYELFKLYAQSDNVNAIEEQVKKFPNYFPPDYASSYGRTLLITAAAAAAPNTCKFLLNYGCDPNSSDVYGLTPLMHAARVSKPEGLKVIRLLIRSGADVSLRDSNNWNVADHASRGGNVDVVKYVLKYWLKPHDGGRIAQDRDSEAAATRGKAINSLQERTHPLIEQDGMSVLHLLIQSRPYQTLEALVLDLHWTREKISLACKNALVTAESPILLSLKIAEAVYNLIPLALSYQNELQKLYDEFTSAGIALVEDLSSDHLVAWSLEASCNGIHDNYDSILDVAIRSKNKRFLTTSRVQRILNFWWENTWFHFFKNNKFVKTQYPMGSFSDSLLQMLIDDPLRAFNVPKLNYSIRVFSFMIFVTLVSYVTYERINIDDKFHTIEYILYMYTFGFLMDEALQFSSAITVYSYIVDNQADIVLYVAAILTFICRIIGDNSSDMFVLYLIASSVWVIIIWIRLIYTCRHFDMMQSIITLLIVLQNMFIDIRNFVSLLVIAIIGWFFAFRFVIASNTVSGFENDGYTFLTLYSTAVSADFDFDALQDVSGVSRTVAQLLAVSYVGISAIVLINMLIAMLSYTFENVRNSSIETLLFERVKHTWQYAKNDDHVLGQVPPFNIFILLVRLLMTPFVWCKGAIKSTENNEWMCSWCGNLPLKHREMLLIKDNKYSALEEIVSCLTFTLHHQQQENSRIWIRDHIGYKLCGECLHIRHDYSPYDTLNSVVPNIIYGIYIIFIWIPVVICVKPLWWSLNAWYRLLDWYRRSRRGYIDPMTQGLHAFGRARTFTNTNNDSKETNPDNEHKFSSNISLASDLSSQETNNIFKFVNLSTDQVAESIVDASGVDYRFRAIEKNINVLMQKISTKENEVSEQNKE